ncbi:uncharacterized protein MONOS_1451 [Monocercomonoides exilis]|uniref:uncharacterized protein n=1 Tax=Monocercomonoides exilis TaxID=2049356 RepID=UPI00355A38A8|nr:hypothetical protein MONOS_1451 [Monocercomonoides exilis]|eukprot:MONOS_1451.1-p1 / transcript=MONOS_1451.1 / gene=MONOS_1451 / organism=Monocercomonoides_exilis_PA203 / gene_product=unspecified product / transcript_product=unspecified product / location=Mono_scaffold00026:15487-15774(+) / protein_length=96 / sequence_SO=supercontig / SO=protein_coding / is_pseudo=false
MKYQTINIFVEKMKMCVISSSECRTAESAQFLPTYKSERATCLDPALLKRIVNWKMEEEEDRKERMVRASSGCNEFRREGGRVCDDNVADDKVEN